MRDNLVGGERTMKGTILRLFTVASLSTSLALFASGCGQKEVSVDEEMEAAEPAQVQEPAPPVEEEVALGEEEPLTTEPQYSEPVTPTISEARTHAPMLPVYFDFDKSSIRADQQPRIEKNAAFLNDNPEIAIRIEGNCDERGTNEYNMALGERRANSAKKYLMNLGVGEDRLNTISYGEEKPLVYGHDETSWSQNRRDDFVVENQ